MLKSRRNKKPNNKNVGPSTVPSEISKRKALNTIDENATIKITRVENEPLVTNSQIESHLDEMFSSEEEVPASQEPTQRYLSQRSNFTSTLMRTQSLMKSGLTGTMRPPSTYFEMLLIKAGVQLDVGDTFVLSCDHMAFVNKLRELFTKSQNYPDNIVTFCQGLRDALSNRSKLTIKLLTGCTINIEGETNVYQSQESMLVNLLMLDFLRGDILDVLLEKIAQIASVQRVVTTLDTNIALLPLILAQLRYVAQTHGNKIYECINRCFENAFYESKCDIIGSAEFILDPSDHDNFAQLLL